MPVATTVLRYRPGLTLPQSFQWASEAQLTRPGLASLAKRGGRPGGPGRCRYHHFPGPLSPDLKGTGRGGLPPVVEGGTAFGLSCL
jgi:hypothetical protein